jgi:hypothetical protein
MIKSRRMILVGHVACTETKKKAYRLLEVGARRKDATRKT